MVHLVPTDVDDPTARTLLEEYVAERRALFPGRYTPAHPPREMFTPPAGVFLVVRDDEDRPVGCGGIRRLDDDANGCRYEVKHLYLRESTRGHGWGGHLLDELERRAGDLGAASLVLDTHHTLTAAGRLYASHGFTPTAPYNDNPNATRWYAKTL